MLVLKLCSYTVGKRSCPLCFLICAKLPFAHLRFLLLPLSLPFRRRIKMPLLTLSSPFRIAPLATILLMIVLLTASCERSSSLLRISSSICRNRWMEEKELAERGVSFSKSSQKSCRFSAEKKSRFTEDSVQSTSAHHHSSIQRYSSGPNNHSSL